MSVERLNHEIKRRTEVVGSFPNEAAIKRLVGTIPLEQTDEWAVQRTRYLPRDTLADLTGQPGAALPAMAG